MTLKIFTSRNIRIINLRETLELLILAYTKETRWHFFTGQEQPAKYDSGISYCLFDLNYDLDFDKKKIKKM